MIETLEPRFEGLDQALESLLKIMVPKSLDLSQALGSMQRIVATRFLDFDQTLGVEQGTVGTKFEGPSQPWVVDYRSSVATMETRFVDLGRA